MTGYWGDPERNRQALVKRPEPGGFESTWFRTGDRVLTLEDGNLAFSGRVDLQVKVRGHRVELEEVENALIGLEHVHEAAVFAIPDDEGSSAIHAAVVIEPGAAVSQKDLARGLRGSLPPYAVPVVIEILLALPRTPTGKVDRNQLMAESSKGTGDHD